MRKGKKNQTYVDAKASGISAQDVYRTVEQGVRARAKKEGWLLSEQAATMTDVAFELRKVYGKRATRFLFEDQDRVFRVMRNCCTSGNCITCRGKSLLGTPIRVVQQDRLTKAQAESIAKGWASYGATVEKMESELRTQCPVCLARDVELVPWGKGRVCRECAQRPVPEPSGLYDVGEGKD